MRSAVGSWWDPWAGGRPCDREEGVKGAPDRSSSLQTLRAAPAWTGGGLASNPRQCIWVTQEAVIEALAPASNQQ